MDTESAVPRNIPMAQLLLMYLGAFTFGYLLVTLAMMVLTPTPRIVHVPVFVDASPKTDATPSKDVSNGNTSDTPR
jgi:hypothetical protein